ncbi:hypothetical protein CC1G_05794 [Coprinopsis cinerea okayama7|uniref:DUF6534 domain-containing protein n=1 Tax=Coprinopsis cinerea (strain Okayama-7 / 130 / ATCC MYA-4618 / FGSC 9003) TaxID=240176 RepID=A8NLD2_COPC7|nr:hypothetical protein CC1G_05794 [Coprinopsis cinerea okayama7\|eukprot:XP_001834657.2 hypothetical protein CC1G_05794 [Coprinopsis cinerea okayama7\
MSAPLPVVNLHDTVGALQLGSLFAVFLFGVVTLQSHLYYQQFRQDKVQLKALVGVIWILELGHTFCVAAEIYKATIIYYGQPQKLFPFPFLGASTAVGGSIAFLAHSFFASRVWKVLPKPWNFIGLFCFVVAVVRFVGSIVLGVNAVKATVLEDYRNDWGWLIMSLLMAGAAIDVIIAGSMLSYLYNQRDKVFSRSVRLIDRLVQYTICTALLPSLSAVVMVICFHVKPTAMIWLAVYSCLAKLYSNCVLASLNSRAELRASTHASSLGTSSKPNRTGPSLNAADPNLSISFEMKSTFHTTQDNDGGEFSTKYPTVHTPQNDSVHKLV